VRHFFQRCPAETIVAASTRSTTTASIGFSWLPLEGVNDLFTKAYSQSTATETTISPRSAADGFIDKFLLAPSNVVTVPTSFSDAFNHFINNQHLQGIANRLGFKHSARLDDIVAAKKLNKAIAKRSCMDLRRLQQSLRRL